MKQLRITILLTVLMSMFGVKTLAHDIEVANKDGVTIYYSWTNDKTELAVIQGSYINEYGSIQYYWYSGDVVIPESVEYNGNTYSVTSIGPCTFYGSSLTSVTIPNSVTTIEASAFRDCSNLTSVDIPNGVISIGIGAFDGTPWYENQPDGLIYLREIAYKYKGEMPENTNITIKSGTISISAGAFSGCSGLVSVDIPNSVTTISDEVFSGCTGLTSVTIPNSVTTIGNEAFSGCTGLTSVDIPNSVTTIGNEAFSGCTGLTSVDIPNSVTSLGGATFKKCSSLTSVTISNSVTRLSSTFWDCSSLTSITIPNSVTSIEWFAFMGCSSLTSITIPKSVTKIGEMNMGRYFHPFRGCNKLTSIKVEEGNPVYDSRDDCNAIILTESNQLIAGFKNTVIPNTVTSIGNNAFYDSGLTSIAIPSSVRQLHEFAFSGCVDLTDIYYYKRQGLFIGDNVFESVPWENVKIHIPESTIDTYNGSNQVVGIKEYVDQQGVKYALNPDGNTYTVLDHTDACSGKIVIPSSVNECSVTSISAYAFNDVEDLTAIKIPSSINSIGPNAFHGCPLTYVYVEIDSPLRILDETFTNCTNATLCVPSGSAEAYKAADYWKEFKSIISIIPPTAIDDLVYTGKAQNLIEAGSPETMLYSLNDTEYSSTIPQGTDAGEYTVYYKEENSETSGSFKMNISSKKVTDPKITLSETSFVYDGNAKEPTVTVKDDEATIPASEYTVSYEDNTEVGTATVTITDNEGGNYTVSGSASFTITKSDDSGEDGVEKVYVSISNSGKTTLTSPYALDFSEFDDLKAYVATGYEGSGTIWLTRVKQVPANTPILIKGESDQTYEVPVLDKCVAYFENMFQGSADNDVKIDATSADGRWNNYYMAKGSFKKVTGPRTIDKGKCYLQLPASFKAAKAGADQTVKIADSGKSSYAPPVDVDLTDIDGLKAYAATGYDAASSTIWLTRINKIQAGEGVMLKGEGGKTYTLPASTEVQAYYGNMMIGNISDPITINETSADGEWTNFYLGSGQFKKVSGSREIGTSKSYLHLPASMLVSSARGKKNAGFDEWFMEELETETMFLGSIGGDDEDGTTRIDAIRNDAQPDVYYNLHGQRVENPRKGLYIKNGVKVVIK